MSELKTKLEEIKRQKDTYILPENLKKDVTVYGVTGTLESGSGDVKLFDTIEHMQQDENPQEGDLAVVYREEIQAVTEESEFSSCIFPNTVVLDEAFSDNIYGSFRAVDGSMFDGMVDMSSSSFNFNGYRESGEIRVQYESEDGITYTRTDGGEALQEFGTTIKWESAGGSFNNVIGNFMQIGGNYFEGIYKFDNNFINKDYIKFLTFSSYEFEMGNEPIVNNFNYLDFTFNVDKILSLVNKIANEVGIWTNGIGLTASSDGRLQLSGGYQNTSSDPHHYTSGGTIYTLNNNKEITGFHNNYWTTILNLEDQTYTAFTYNTLQITPYTGIIEIQQDMSGKLIIYNSQGVSYLYNNKIIYMETQKIIPYKIEQKYVNIGSNLNATPDYVYGKTFYGKNGVEDGTLTTNASNSFVDVNAEVYAKIQAQYDDMTPRVLTDQDKTIDTNIIIIPCKSDGTSLLDTSNVTSMDNMFVYCKNLSIISLIDTSNVTSMAYMFQSCTSLTTIPLLDTSKVTNMSHMFVDCTNLTTVPLLDTSNVTYMGSMFAGCNALTTIPLLDTSNVTYMGAMFVNCTNLTTVPLLNTSNATTIGNLFNGCTSLTTVPQLDTSNVTIMNNTFSICTSLTTIPLLDTSKVTNMSYMFSGCTSLTTIPLLNTSNATNMSYMFRDCTSLTNESLNTILTMCTNATKITSNKTLKYIGLTAEQSTTCTTLSNYQAFTNAGWTTGY